MVAVDGLDHSGATRLADGLGVLLDLHFENACADFFELEKPARQRQCRKHGFGGPSHHRRRRMSAPCSLP